jgi:hypothetical protein
MKGEKVDLNSIKNSVVGEMKGVQQVQKNFGQEAKAFAEEKGKAIGCGCKIRCQALGRSLGISSFCWLRPSPISSSAAWVSRW